MKAWLKWSVAGVAIVAVAALVLPARTYLASQRVLQKRYAVETPPLGPALVGAAEAGKRLAAIYGCADCHGDDLRGRPLMHPAPFAQVHSANLTLTARTWSDQDFARMIRQGVKRDGTSSFQMPSESFTHMSDADVAAVIAHVRSLPAGGESRPALTMTWTARRQLASGAYPPGVKLVGENVRKFPADAGPALARGRYLTSVACAECHGPELKGEPGGPPDLGIAAAYELQDFAHLMRTGKAAGNRELPLMSQTARRRFSHFTDTDIADIHAYLTARARMAP